MISNQIKEESSAYVFDIQGLSMHDGPGCRTTVFLSGCTLECLWCSNPEGIWKSPVPMYFTNKCIACDNCINACEKNAIKREKGRLNISRELCLNCENRVCVTVCYTDALKLSAYKISSTELMRIIQLDRQFWGEEGGVTLSGGEPLLQISFVEDILKLCHESYIHTAIETCGNSPYQNFQKVIPFLDWIFFDLKHFDTVTHVAGTKTNNTLIIENAKRLAQDFSGRLIFRIPIILGFNDSESNIKSVIEFLKKIGKDEINLLPLHHLGREKYPAVNKEYQGIKYQVPANIDLVKIQQVFMNKGIHCYIGSNTPF